MNLELKHIASYLPYELQISRDSKHFGRLHALYDKANKAEIEFEFGYYRYLIKDLKPLLRPLKDLSANVNDKIPIIEFWNDGLFGEHLKTKPFPKDFLDEWTLSELMDNISFDNYHKLFEYLYSNHFDVANLIEKNLAIDINTIGL